MEEPRPRPRKYTLRHLRQFPFLKAHELRRALILCHRHADVDAYGAAYGVHHLLRRISRRIQVTVACPEGLGVPAKKVAEKLPLPITEQLTTVDPDLIVIVDTGHAGLLAEWLDVVRTSEAKKIAIVHHPLDQSISSIVDHAIIDEKSSSASEMVYRLLSATGMRFSTKVSTALLAGILYDSQHLRLASRATLRAVCDLCATRDLLPAVKQLLHTPRDRSEIIARLKGAQRMTLYDAGGTLISTARIGSFHASVARAMVSLGADVGIVTDEKKDESRVTLRSSDTFRETTRIHLGLDLAGPIAQSHGGIGGGHPTAASLTLKAYNGDLAREVLKTLTERLGADPRPLK